MTHSEPDVFSSFAIIRDDEREIASRKIWPSERSMPSCKQQPCLFVCYQSTSTVPCGIHLALPQARSTKLFQVGAAVKVSYVLLIRSQLKNMTHNIYFFLQQHAIPGRPLSYRFPIPNNVLVLFWWQAALCHHRVLSRTFD